MIRSARHPSRKLQRNRRAPVEAAPKDRWLLSYADFITLLLALFIVLYASARFDSTTSRKMLEGIENAFVTAPITTTRPRAEHESPRDLPGRDGVLEAPIVQTDLYRSIESILAAHPATEGVSPGVGLHADERGIILTLASSEFFPAGGVEIPPERQAILSELAPLFDASQLPIRFEGHTDDEPIRSDFFPSNWELSTARAGRVARFFIDEHGLDPRRIATSGYAEFRPIVPNDSTQHRAQNRRVEMILLYTDAGTDESYAHPSGRTDREKLERLLTRLPPIPDRADQSLAPSAPAPPPVDIPLP